MDQKPAICVFCGSANGNNPNFLAVSEGFARGLVEAGFRLVYGGGGRGLMGTLAKTVLAEGGGVTGIMPDFLRRFEMPADDGAELILTTDLQQRKALMLDEAAAFAVLPGGAGTMDEFFEVVTTANLGRLNRPVVVVNADDYFAPLFALMDHMIEQGFTHPEYGKVYDVVDTPEQAIALLKQALS